MSERSERTVGGAMVQTGSRLLLGAAFLATLGAVVYGVAQGGSLGTTGLIFAAAALAMLAGVNLWARDSDVSAMDPALVAQSPAAASPPPAAMWPIIAAAGGVLVVVGLVSYPVVFIFGIIALLAAAAEWMVQGWSDRASADAAFNADVRTRMAHPLEFPVLAAVGVGVIIYSFSRIMLFLSAVGGVAVFGLIAACILLGGFFIAFRPSLRSGAIASVSAIAALGLVAGGAAAALDGERELHPHETVGDLAAAGDCDTTEETEADENASQTVGAIADLTGELVLREDGTLVARNAGLSGVQDRFIVTRANTTNVRFRNETDEPRRLLLDLGTVPDVDAEGEPIEGTAVPNQRCTALTDEGATQFMSFTITSPSESAEQPYRFVVPGVPGAEVEVVVP